VDDGAGIELLTCVEELDLPDPDRVLADPDAFQLPERGDRQLAFLTDPTVGGGGPDPGGLAPPAP
jgi:hypothetical protein